MAKPKRKRIGRWSDLVTRHVVYRTPEGLEIDDLDHLRIQRTRVLFEDVLLVTRHNTRGVGFIVGMTLFGAALFGIGIAIRELAGIITFGILAAPFLLMALLRTIFGIEVLTVFGKRSRARMRFAFRRAYAARLFAELTDAVREAQERLAAEIRANEPPAPPPLDAEIPMPPPSEGPADGGHDDA